MAFGHGARFHGASELTLLAHIERTPRRTVATLVARLVVEHGDCDRQTALDFGGESSTSQRATSATSRSGVHVIDCDALLDAGEREIGGAA